jgi:hypothetical protein
LFCISWLESKYPFGFHFPWHFLMLFFTPFYQLDLYLVFYYSLLFFLSVYKKESNLEKRIALFLFFLIVTWCFQCLFSACSVYFSIIMVFLSNLYQRLISLSVQFELRSVRVVKGVQYSAFHVILFKT